MVQCGEWPDSSGRKITEFRSRKSGALFMMRRVLIAAVVMVLLGAAITAVFCIRQARRDAARSRAFGRLCQLRLSLEIYEDLHGTLPPRLLQDRHGNPTHSWLALVLSQLEQKAIFDKLDASKGWDTATNADAIKLGRPFWDWFSEDGYFPCALKSEASIWDPESGSPRGLLKQFPDSIVLIAVPLNGVHPLQPFGIDKKDLRQALEAGQEVLFISCDGVYGTVRIEDGDITYLPSVPR